MPRRPASPCPTRRQRTTRTSRTALMRTRVWCGAIGLFLQAVPLAAQEATAPRYTAYPLTAEYDVRVRMRDGIHLSADVYRPADAGRHPTLFELTPYNNNSVNPGAGGPSTPTEMMDRAWKAVRRGY